MSLIKCQLVEVNGDHHWQATEFVSDSKKSSFFAGGPTETVYSILRDGIVVDHREEKFFRERGVLSASVILPCPACGAKEERQCLNAPLLHVESWYPGLKGYPEVHTNEQGTRFVRRMSEARRIQCYKEMRLF